MHGCKKPNIQMGARAKWLYKHVYHLPRRGAYCRSASFSPPTYQWKKAMSE